MGKQGVVLGTRYLGTAIVQIVLNVNLWIMNNSHRNPLVTPGAMGEEKDHVI